MPVLVDGEGGQHHLTEADPDVVGVDVERADSPEVTIVLPCFNEEAHIIDELERIRNVMDASGHRYELLVIDDGSTDGTPDLLREALPEYPRTRLLCRHRNGGSGTVRRIGTREARGDIVVWTDADLTYPNHRIPDLIDHLLKNPRVDQVVGSRTTEQGTHKVLRVPAKWSIRRLAEFLSGERIPDLNSGLRAFRREASLPYLRLLPPGFSCTTTMTLAFLCNQHEVEYVPIEYARRSGRSKFHFIRDTYRYFLQVLRMIMYFNPLRVLMPLALMLLSVGVGKGIYDMVAHPVRLASNTLLLILAGLIIAAIALLADLIVRSRTS